MLNSFNSDVIKGIVTKQLAKQLLAKQSNIVIDMMNDGLLSTKDTIKFIEEISADNSKIEKLRNKMYKKQMEEFANFASKQDISALSYVHFNNNTNISNDNSENRSLLRSNDEFHK